MTLGHRSPTLTPPVYTRPSFAEFVQYLAIGGGAALANLVSRYFLTFVVPFEAAVVLAYMIGMVVGFALFQIFLFSARTFRPRSVMRFIWVNIFGAALAWAVSTLMARQILPAIGWAWRPFEIAHFVGVATPAISSYYLNKYYTFA